jgi:hypothetical protein
VRGRAAPDLRRWAATGRHRCCPAWLGSGAFVRGWGPAAADQGPVALAAARSLPSWSAVSWPGRPTAATPA